MEQEKQLIKTHEDLDIYQLAFDAAMQIFVHSKTFPVEEKYSLTDPVRCSSRSVCANLAEAWRKRRYKAAFVAKLNELCNGCPSSPSPFSRRRRGAEVPLPRERDTGRGHFQLHNSLRLAISR